MKSDGGQQAVKSDGGQQAAMSHGGQQAVPLSGGPGLLICWLLLGSLARSRETVVCKPCRRPCVLGVRHEGRGVV